MKIFEADLSTGPMRRRSACSQSRGHTCLVRLRLWSAVFLMVALSVSIDEALAQTADDDPVGASSADSNGVAGRRHPVGVVTVQGRLALTGLEVLGIGESGHKMLIRGRVLFKGMALLRGMRGDSLMQEPVVILMGRSQSGVSKDDVAYLHNKMDERRSMRSQKEVTLNGRSIDDGLRSREARVAATSGDVSTRKSCNEEVLRLRAGRQGVAVFGPWPLPKETWEVTAEAAGCLSAGQVVRIPHRGPYDDVVLVLAVLSGSVLRRFVKVLRSSSVRWDSKRRARTAAELSAELAPLLAPMEQELLSYLREVLDRTLCARSEPSMEDAFLARDLADRIAKIRYAKVGSEGKEN